MVPSVATALLSGSDTSILRTEVDERIAAGDLQTARRCVDELWRQDKGSATASFVVSRYERMRNQLGLLPYRVAVLRSFTVEPLVPLLRAGGYAAGIDFTVHIGQFNAYAQEILDPGSTLYEFGADTVILAVQARDLALDLCSGYVDLKIEDRHAAVQRVAKTFHDWVKAFRRHSTANLILHSLEEPPVLSQGIFDAQSEETQRSLIQKINCELRRLAQENDGVYVLDYDGLVARYGRLGWHDERKSLTLQMPIASGHLINLAKEWLRFLHPLTGKIVKVLVVDLDNTLWGGVIGEDGVNGICLDGEHPGACYQAVQRTLLDFYRRGILLAVCSKNNSDEVMEVLQNHPGMLLSPQQFAAMRINWKEKAQNLREIAAELNIGTDALAFMDDNPVEREQVRVELPEVTVIDLPSSPALYAQTLREYPVFERLVLSEEDQKRGDYYTAERRRVELGKGWSSLEDFYRNLEQEVEIAAVTSQTLPRVAQLTQKTNQFNLTTRRYTEQQIADKLTRTDWRVFAMRVRDRCADNGLVGVAIIHNLDNVCEVDTFLLSCRVIGRTVETALLSYLITQAQADGLSRIQGWFFPTKKNEPAKAFYQRHGFSLETQDDRGSLWALDLSECELKCPDWIHLISPTGENR